MDDSGTTLEWSAENYDSSKYRKNERNIESLEVVNENERYFAVYDLKK